jgi:putative membrane protein
MIVRYNMGWVLIGGVAFLLLAGCLIRFGLFGGMMFGGGIYGWGPGMMGGGYGWMGIGMILFGLLTLVGIYLLFSSYQPRWFGRRNDALLIARERYARGEITQEEFEKIRRDLE